LTFTFEIDIFFEGLGISHAEAYSKLLGGEVFGPGSACSLPVSSG